MKNPYRDGEGRLTTAERASSRFDPELVDFERKMRAVADDQGRADEIYDALPDTFGGKVIGTDLARWLLPEYGASREGHLTYVNATGRVAQAYAKDRLWREITDPRGRERLFFTAGGVAAGKTSILTEETVGAADLVFDGTLRETEWAIGMIRLAVECGWDVRVEYIQRPLGQVIQDAIDRAQVQGRWGALADLPLIHQIAQASVLRIAETFVGNPRVSVWCWINDGSLEAPAEGTLVLRESISPGGEFSYAETADRLEPRGAEPPGAGGFPDDRGAQREALGRACQDGTFPERWQPEVRRAFRAAIKSGQYDRRILKGLAGKDAALRALLEEMRGDEER